MTQVSEATERPWWLFDVNGVVAIKAPVVGECSGDEVVFWTGFDSSHFPEQARANAALIVTAVNGWDALVAERDALKAELEKLKRGL